MPEPRSSRTTAMPEQSQSKNNPRRNTTMRTLTRRSFVASAAAGVTTFALLKPAMAATYKLATNLPAGHPMLTRLQEAADKIAADTNGEFTLRFFPNSQLGGDLEVLSQLRSGAIQFYPLAGAQLSNL